ncbi:RASGRP3 [Mytilus edulis]|uniref:RASGRP3 n=1 Tax=Mytilus edulis TaxID=6550 RepID=A0A8S3VC90_MYTED|nr:RASGRP3 [Mytilus edulis]
MLSKLYQANQQQHVNVEVQASYSGMVSVGAGFKLESSQKTKASNFQKSVTTKTITVGAPPPLNGDASEWASGVKDSPVPMEYKMNSIENLFTEKYMNYLNVSVSNISKQLKNAQSKYCKYLKHLGKLNSCDPVKPGLVLKETVMAYFYKSFRASSFSECIDLCRDDIYCLAATFCTGCTWRHGHYHGCFMYNRSKTERV